MAATLPLPAAARLAVTAVCVPAVALGFGGPVALVASLVLVLLWWGRGGMALATMFLASAALAALVVARSPKRAAHATAEAVPAARPNTV